MSARKTSECLLNMQHAHPLGHGWNPQGDAGHVRVAVQVPLPRTFKYEAVHPQPWGTCIRMSVEGWKNACDRAIPSPVFYLTNLA